MGWLIFLPYIDPPVIITSPMSQVKKGRSTPNMLNCNASTYDGQVLYHWESRGFQDSQWTALTSPSSDGTSYTTFTAVSEQYRCVATNDAGETRSKIANVTVLSKMDH